MERDLYAHGRYRYRGMSNKEGNQNAPDSAVPSPGPLSWPSKEYTEAHLMARVVYYVRESRRNTICARQCREQNDERSLRHADRYDRRAEGNAQEARKYLAKLERFRKFPKPTHDAPE
jgi:hypothetical protein